MTKKKKKVGRPDSYHSQYAEMIVKFFNEPAYFAKDITITYKDGSTKEVTELEANPPLFLSDFAEKIGLSLLSYRKTLNQWAEKYEEFGNALKVAKELEEKRIRINGSMSLYSAAFSIFTMKNIAGWRDKQEITGADGGPLEVMVKYA